MSDKMRSWVAVFQYPGKQTCQFGHLHAVAPDALSTADLLEHFYVEFKTKFYEVFPDDVPLPDLVDIRCGALIFTPDSTHGETNK